MLEALREKPNRHQSFFNGILPSLEDFDEFEVLEFQMDVLKSIKNIKQRKLCAAGVAVEGFKASRNLAHHQPFVDTPRAPQCNTGVQHPPTAASPTPVYATVLQPVTTASFYEKVNEYLSEPNYGYSPRASSESSSYGESFDFSRSSI